MFRYVFLAAATFISTLFCIQAQTLPYSVDLQLAPAVNGLIVAGNFSGDARDEIAILNASGLFIYNPFDPALPVPHAFFQSANDINVAVVAGDLDDDGYDDLVVSEKLSGSISPAVVKIVLVSSTGISATTINVMGAVSSPPRLIDLDGDGDLDIVAGKTVFTNSGSGTFPSPVYFSTPTPQVDLCPGDFDGDGDLDLLSYFFGNSSIGAGLTVRVFRRNSNGSYTLLTSQILIPNLFSGLFVEAEDWNGDGKDDLVVNAGSSVHTLAAGPSFTFAPVASRSLVGLNPQTKMFLHDVDQNGIRDVVSIVAPTFQSTTSTSLPFLLLRDSSGGFFEGQGRFFERPAGLFYQRIFPAAGDFDGDGIRELTFLTMRPVPFDYFLAIHELAPVQNPLSEDPLISVVANPALGPGMGVGDVLFNLNFPDGVPAAGRNVTFSVTSPDPTFVSVTSFGVSAGPEVSTRLSVGTYGQYTVTASLEDGHSISTLVDVTFPNPAIARVSGNNQTQLVGFPFPMPLVARRQIGAGQTLHWRQISGPPLPPFTTQTLTNAAGEASLSVVASMTPGEVVIRVGLSPLFLPPPNGFAPNSFTYLDFRLTVLPMTGELAIAGLDQAFVAGQTSLRPLEVTLTHLGQPQSGVNINFLPQDSLLQVNPSQAVTDVNGKVSTFVSGTANGSGQTTLLVIAPTGGVELDLFKNGSSAAFFSGSVLLAAHYRRPNVPLLITVDAPMPPPGFTSSLFGPIYTSILAPQSSLVVLDGWGLFGTPDPSLTTGPNGTWFRSFSVPSVSGLSLVLQFIAYDAEFPFPSSIVPLNPLTLQF